MSNQNHEIVDKRTVWEMWKAFLQYWKSIKLFDSQNVAKKANNDFTPDNEFVDLELDTKIGARMGHSGVQMAAKGHVRGKFSWESLRILLFFLPRPKEQKQLD